MRSEKPRVLVIDDEAEVRNSLRQTLSFLGFHVVTAADGWTGISRYAKDGVDLVLVDLKMPDVDGLEVIRQLKAQDEEVLAVVMTGYGSVDSAVEAMKSGAVDYLEKPLDADCLEIVLNRTLERYRQAERLRLLEEQVLRQGSFEGLVGVCPEMLRVYDVVRQAAKSDATVLIQGETGTGKELVACAIHNRSYRKANAFVPVNCGALTETILESELFGHEKGAFTGADSQKYGLIEQAEGGTFFLDEIEEMSSALQVKLLRAIQEREVLRVGGERPIPVDFRLVASSNVDLHERMQQGTFRTDLFYRLSVVVIDLPPLRARRQDIPLLARHFAAIYGGKRGRRTMEIMQETMMVLKSYAWPGNVRELENAIEHAVVFCDGKAISVEHLSEHIRTSAAAPGGSGFYGVSLGEVHEKLERQYLQEVLARAEGKVSEAARLAGVSRQHFYYKMRRHNLSRGGSSVGLC